MEEKTVTDSLERVGLPGVIFDSETDSYAKGHIVYVIRSPSETYDGTENRKLIAVIGSADYKGGRVLFTTFDQSVAAQQIVFEDWKRQIVLAALLYGGFDNEECIFQALLDAELPDSQTSFSWDAQLAGGYCRISYSPHSNTVYDDNGFEVRKQSASLRVNIYESYEFYEKLKNG